MALVVLLGLKIAARNAWGADVRADIESIKNNYYRLAKIPTGLVLAIAKVESNLNPKAKGAAGERGLMQVLPMTWDWIFSRQGMSPPIDPFNQYSSILGGMMVLEAYHESTGNWLATIHAYNVGAGGYKSGRRNWPYFQKVLSWWAAA